MMSFKKFHKIIFQFTIDNILLVVAERVKFLWPWSGNSTASPKRAWSSWMDLLRKSFNLTTKGEAHCHLFSNYVWLWHTLPATHLNAQQAIWLALSQHVQIQLSKEWFRPFVNWPQTLWPCLHVQRCKRQQIFLRKGLWNDCCQIILLK